MCADFNGWMYACVHTHNQNSIRRSQKVIPCQIWLFLWLIRFVNANKQIHVWQRLVTTRAPTDHFTPKNQSSTPLAHSQIINKHDSAWNGCAIEWMRPLLKWINLSFSTANHLWWKKWNWFFCSYSLLIVGFRFQEVKYEENLLICGFLKIFIKKILNCQSLTLRSVWFK